MLAAVPGHLPGGKQYRTGEATPRRCVAQLYQAPAGISADAQAELLPPALDDLPSGDGAIISQGARSVITFSCMPSGVIMPQDLPFRNDSTNFGFVSRSVTVFGGRKRDDVARRIK
jgi:hypothetical protein